MFRKWLPKLLLIAVLWICFVSALPAWGQVTSTYTLTLRSTATGKLVIGKNVDLYQNGVKVYDLTEIRPGVYTHTAVATGKYDVYVDGQPLDGYQGIWIGADKLTLIESRFTDAGELTTAGVKDSAISWPKLNPSVQDSIRALRLGPDTIDSTHVKTFGLTSSDLKDAIITWPKLSQAVQDSIRSGSGGLGPNTVDSTHIKTGGIGRSDLPAGIIDSLRVAPRNIYAGHIAIETLTGLEIKNGSIDYPELETQLNIDITNNTSFRQAVDVNGDNKIDSIGIAPNSIYGAHVAPEALNGTHINGIGLADLDTETSGAISSNTTFRQAVDVNGDNKIDSIGIAPSSIYGAHVAPEALDGSHINNIAMNDLSASLQTDITDNKTFRSSVDPDGNNMIDSIGVEASAISWAHLHASLQDSIRQGSSPWAVSGNNIYRASGQVTIGATAPVGTHDLTIKDVDANDASLFLGASGTGSAKLVLDASDGDGIGSDYSEIYVDNQKNLIFRQQTFAGNIYLIASNGDTLLTIQPGGVQFGTANMPNTQRVTFFNGPSGTSTALFYSNGKEAYISFIGTQTSGSSAVRIGASQDTLVFKMNQVSIQTGVAPDGWPFVQSANKIWQVKVNSTNGSREFWYGGIKRAEVDTSGNFFDVYPN